MNEALQVPEELQSTFKRLLNRIPFELRSDIRLQQKLLIFLKFGGEKLARQEIDIAKKRFMEEIDIVRRMPSEDLPEDPNDDSIEEDLPEEP